MAHVTIRRNSKKRINGLLDTAALVTQYKYDDMDTNTNTRSNAATVKEMLESGRITSITAETDDAGVIETVMFTVHQNWFFSMYMTKHVAKRRLIAKAYDKYFPEKPEYRYNWERKRPELVLI